MTDMIEKVARAIYDTWAEHEGLDCSWDELQRASARGETSRRIRDLAFAEARAAIKAMRELTDAMVLAGCRKSLPSIFAHGLEGLPTDGPNTQQAMAKVRAAVQAGHAAMIDAALSD